MIFNSVFSFLRVFFSCHSHVVLCRGLIVLCSLWYGSLALSAAVYAQESLTSSELSSKNIARNFSETKNLSYLRVTITHKPYRLAEEPATQIWVTRFRIRIDRGYHINSHTPLDTNLIATEVHLLEETNKPSRWHELGVVYPEPTIRKLRTANRNSLDSPEESSVKILSADLMVSLYENKPITITAVAQRLIANSSGHSPPPIYTFLYQLCSERYCYPPKTLETKAYAGVTGDQGELNILPLELSSLIYPSLAKSPSSQKDTIAGKSERRGMKVALALLFAFLGGIILNFMPCVLPVVYLKIFSLLRTLADNSSAVGTDDQAKKKKTIAELRKSFLAFGAGIYSIFVILSISAAVLQATGKAVGWGFQFQNSFYVFGLLLLTWFSGLHLLHGFTLSFFQLSWKGPSGEKLGGKKTSREHFHLGMLTALLATPCTAPLLSPAIGYLFSQSPWTTLLAIQASGIGLALPYWILSIFGRSPWLVNGVHKLIPKPGPWTALLEQVFAFILIGISLWLLHIMYALRSFQIVEVVLLYLLGGSMILILTEGRSLHKGTSRALRRRIIRFIFFIGATLWAIVALSGEAGLSQDLSSLSPEGSSQNNNTTVITSFPYPAQTLNAATLASALSSNRYTYVHITALWCLSCQVNEFVLQRERTLQLFKDFNVRVLIGDWTKEDPFIAAYLRENNRAGIPFDALYHPNQKTKESGNITIFSEILTYKAIASALAEPSQ